MVLTSAYERRSRADFRRSFAAGRRDSAGDDVPVTHHVDVHESGEWLRAKLGFDPRAPIGAAEWLTVPQQILLEVTAGDVFHDGLDELVPARDALAWYPEDIWLWLLACQWRRIDQGERFVGRTAEVGDELGSRIVAARLVRTQSACAFSRSAATRPIASGSDRPFVASRHSTPSVTRSLKSWLPTTLQLGQSAFAEAITTIAARQNALRVTVSVDEGIRLFHDRPFRVLGLGCFIDACLERVSDPWLRSLPLVGAIDQFVDSTDVLSKPDVFPRTAAVYKS